SELELCEKFNVSRTTTRKAMQILEKEGLITIIHGKGTFVSSSIFNQSLIRFYSFTDEMKKIGKVPSSVVLSFDTIKADDQIYKKMNICSEELVYKLVRVRLADDEPILFETTYLPVSRFPGLKKEQFEARPMYEIFQQDYRVTLDRGA